MRSFVTVVATTLPLSSRSISTTARESSADTSRRPSENIDPLSSTSMEVSGLTTALTRFWSERMRCSFLWKATFARSPSAAAPAVWPLAMAASRAA